MGKVQKYRRGIGAFISSENGQRFFNFAYSIGAAIVIWGALFKILHLPGGNALLSIGMGTEVLMFVLTAFDRPPREYQWEQVFPALKGEGQPIEGGIGGAGVTQTILVDAEGNPVYDAQGSVVYGGTAQSAQVQGAQVDMGGAQEASQALTEHLSTLAQDMQALHETTLALNEVSSTLNRNITSLNTLYDLQLRSITTQLHNLDNAAQGIATISDSYARTAAQSLACSQETEKMAHNIAQLNAIYSRMLTAMMPQQPFAAPAQAPAQPDPSAQPAV